VRTSVAAHWAALDNHFQRHAKLIDRFRQAGPDAVRRMWSSQTNEEGKNLLRRRSYRGISVPAALPRSAGT